MCMYECIWLYSVIVILVFDDDTCTAVKWKIGFWKHWNDTVPLNIDEEELCKLLGLSCIWWRWWETAFCAEQEGLTAWDTKIRKLLCVCREQPGGHEAFGEEMKLPKGWHLWQSNWGEWEYANGHVKFCRSLNVKRRNQNLTGLVKGKSLNLQLLCKKIFHGGSTWND